MLDWGTSGSISFSKQVIILFFWNAVRGFSRLKLETRLWVVHAPLFAKLSEFEAMVAGFCLVLFMKRRVDPHEGHNKPKQLDNIAPLFLRSISVAFLVS